jgi:hypothetical protein
MRRPWERPRRPEDEPAGPTATTPVGTQWENRLHEIGTRVDATSSKLHSVIVSITDTDVWVAGMESNAVRGQLGWSARLVQVEEQPGTMPAGATGDGPWATRLRSVGWALDREDQAVAAPCILHREPGFLVTAQIATAAGWVQTDWRLTETGLRDESI